MPPPPGVDDKLRDGVTGSVTAQTFDDLDAFRDRSAEVRRTVDQVALVNVVGTHPAHEQFVHERFHRLEIVVHAGQQHALVPERNAGVGETLERLFHLNR